MAKYDLNEWKKIKEISVNQEITPALLALIIQPTAPLPALDEKFQWITQAWQLPVKKRIAAYVHCVDEAIIDIEKQVGVFTKYIWPNAELTKLRAYRKKLKSVLLVTLDNGEASFKKASEFNAITQKIAELNVASTLKEKLMTFMNHSKVSWDAYVAIDPEKLMQLAGQASSLSLFNQGLALSINSNPDLFAEFIAAETDVDKTRCYARTKVENLTKGDLLLHYINSAEFNAEVFEKIEGQLADLEKLSVNWFCANRLELLSTLTGGWHKEFAFYNVLASASTFATWDNRTLSALLRYSVDPIVRKTLTDALKRYPVPGDSELWGKFYLAVESKLGPEKIRLLFACPDVFCTLEKKHFDFMALRTDNELACALKEPNVWSDAYFPQLATMGALKISRTSLTHLLTVKELSEKLVSKYKGSHHFFAQQSSSVDNMQEIADRCAAIMQTTILSVELRFRMLRSYYEETLQTLKCGRIIPNTNRSLVLAEYFDELFQLDDKLPVLTEDERKYKKYVDLFVAAQQLLNDPDYSVEGKTLLTQWLEDPVKHSEEVWQFLFEAKVEAGVTLVDLIKNVVNHLMFDIQKVFSAPPCNAAKPISVGAPRVGARQGAWLGEPHVNVRGAT